MRGGALSTQTVLVLCGPRLFLGEGESLGGEGLPVDQHLTYEFHSGNLLRSPGESAPFARAT